MLSAGAVPTRPQKNALAGTDGSPDVGNEYVTRSHTFTGGAGGNAALGNVTLVSSGLGIAGQQNYNNMQIGPVNPLTFGVGAASRAQFTVTSATNLKVGGALSFNAGFYQAVIISIVGTTITTVSNFAGFAASGSVQQFSPNVSTSYSALTATNTSFTGILAGDSLKTQQFVIFVQVASLGATVSGDLVDDTLGNTATVIGNNSTQLYLLVTAPSQWAATGAFHNSTHPLSTTYVAGPTALQSFGTADANGGVNVHVDPISGPWPSNPFGTNGANYYVITDTTTPGIYYFGTSHSTLSGSISTLNARGLHLKVKGNLILSQGGIFAGAWGTAPPGGAGGLAGGYSNQPGGAGSAGTAATNAAYYITAGGGGGCGAGGGGGGSWTSGHSTGGSGGGAGAGAHRGTILDNSGAGAAGSPPGAGSSVASGTGANGASGGAATPYAVVDPRPWRTDFDPPFEVPVKFGPGAPGGGGGGGGGAGGSFFGQKGFDGGQGGNGGTGGGPLIVEVGGTIAAQPATSISADGAGANGGFQSASNPGGSYSGCGSDGGAGGGGGGGAGAVMVLSGGAFTGQQWMTLTLASATGFNYGDTIQHTSSANQAFVTALNGVSLTARITAGTWPASGAITDVNSSTSTTYTNGFTQNIVHAVGGGGGPGADLTGGQDAGPALPAVPITAGGAGGKGGDGGNGEDGFVWIGTI